MKSLSKSFILLLLNLLVLSSENPCVKLSGKTISSELLSSPNINNAFDGNINTAFKADKPSKGWIGLKLDSKYIITKIGFAFPKDSKKNDYLLGILEVSNDPNFEDSNILYMLTEEMTLGEVKYISINSNKRYKYIRYIGPDNSYCVISEFEIYGDDELDTIAKFKDEEEQKKA